MWKNQLEHRLDGKLDEYDKQFPKLPKEFQNIIYRLFDKLSEETQDVLCAILEKKYIKNKSVFLTDAYFTLPSETQNIG